MGLDFLEPPARLYPGVAIARRGELAPPFHAFSRGMSHGIPEYSTVDDDYDYDPIPLHRLPDKPGPSKLRTSLSFATISSHLTVASTSSSSSSDLEHPYPLTPSYSDSYPDTPSSVGRSSLESGNRPVIDLSPLRPRRRQWSGDSGRGSPESLRNGYHEDSPRNPPVYVRESPRRSIRPLPSLPRVLSTPPRSSVPRPLPIPIDPPPYSAIHPPYHNTHRKSIRPLPQPPSTVMPRPHSAVPPRTCMKTAQEPWASAEEGLRQVPVTEVIDWDAVEEIMLSAASDDEDIDSDSTIGPD